MPFRLEHEFQGESYTVVGDAGQLHVVGPDWSDVLFHFVHIFRECSIDVTALHQRRTIDGLLDLEFTFELEHEEDLTLLVQELSGLAPV